VGGAGNGGEGEQAGQQQGGEAGSLAGKGGKGGKGGRGGTAGHAGGGKGGRGGTAGHAGDGSSGMVTAGTHGGLGGAGAGGAAAAGTGTGGSGVGGGGTSGGGAGGAGAGGAGAGGAGAGGAGAGGAGAGGAGVGGAGVGGAGAGSGYGGMGGDACDGITCSGHGTCEIVGEEPECQCEAGYEPGDELSCVDVDECATDHGGCDPLTLCSNTTGGRLCGACPSGYGGTGDTACVADACGDGIPGVDCPCLWVRSDGDDILASISLGLTPFANVQPAIEFSAEHPNAPRHVCVVGGATCSDWSTYPGPEDGLVMRNGVSVHGSYEATDSTACDRLNTSIELATPEGVAFGPEVTDATTFEYFRLFRHMADATTAISITSARNVALRGLEITDAETAGLLHGVDVTDGAEVVMDDVILWPLTNAASNGEAVGLHSLASRVNATRCVFDMIGGGHATGVWFEDSPGSSFHDGQIRLQDSGATTGLSLVGIRATGDVSDILIAGSMLNVGPSGVPELRGIALDGAGEVSMLGNSVNLIGVGSGIEVRSARAIVESSVTMTSSFVAAYGIDLNDAPGSRVTAAITLKAAGAGVRIEGDAEGTSVVGSTIDTINDGVGILLRDCGGAAPSIANNPRIAATGLTTTEAIVSIGNCHPRIASNEVISAKGRSVTTGIRCSALEGIPSRCEVVDNVDIHTEVTLTEPGVSGPSTGVLCEAGGCAEISRNTIVGLTQAELGCLRSCFYEAYGITLENTDALVDDNQITAGCADRAAGIRALGTTTSLIENNAVVGRGGSCSPAPDNIISSYGLYATGAPLVVVSNSFDPGSTANEIPSGVCTSAGVFSPIGAFTGNTFRAGACGKRADFWAPSYPGGPTLVSNDFIAGAPLYGNEFGFLTLEAINALPGASGNFSSP
jgi:hypothetical protein